jgi:hypothetical protein
MCEFRHLHFRLGTDSRILRKSIGMPYASKIVKCFLGLLRGNVGGQPENRECSGDGLTTRHGSHLYDIHKVNYVSVTQQGEPEISCLLVVRSKYPVRQRYMLADGQRRLKNKIHRYPSERVHG